jgi:hypothetical protein
MASKMSSMVTIPMGAADINQHNATRSYISRHC